MTPDEYTNEEFFLDVGDGHRVYVQDWGNARALPIMYLHGGPGNGVDNRDKQKFDPRTQRIIFHDQRGAGKSVPYGSLENNTTPKLVEDIEKIAEQLGIKKFVMLGGSWGSTLALAYGIKYPQRVTALVINGVFTASRAEHDWLNRGGWRTFFPDVWQRYTETAPQTHRADPTAYHLEHAFSDGKQAKKSVYAFGSMELALLKLDDQYAPPDFEFYDPSDMRVEMHYIANNFFMPDNYIINHAKQLKMPVWMIQGRYDMVCPPEAAYTLHQVLPQSHLNWTISGHLRQHEAHNIQRLILERITEQTNG